MTTQVSTETPRPTLNRVMELAHMTRALWAATGGEGAGGLNPEDADWLSLLGCQLASEMIQGIEAYQRVDKVTQEAPWADAGRRA
ncbi:hypothetical protein [Lysobacter enzymogenes]|uniref:hypothetical protein n=1 Tax=Lysobacter enzymogenes TaxID=69 RepID=UPI001A97946D|nr:hypothetical protein [Lysobacter enzymogenes]QQP97945.1 hypothetical protein JHW38_08060 [Lysobacter enzymogenes]